MKGWKIEDIKRANIHISDKGKATNIVDKKKAKKPKPKQQKAVSGIDGKSFIEYALIAKKVEYVKEYKFDAVRRFRADYAVISMKLLIEYNGIISTKSRHTSITGYSRDMTKINLAQINGWKVLQYTPLTFKDFVHDLNTLLETKNLHSL